MCLFNGRGEISPPPTAPTFSHFHPIFLKLKTTMLFTASFGVRVGLGLQLGLGFGVRVGVGIMVRVEVGIGIGLGVRGP